MCEVSPHGIPACSVVYHLPIWWTTDNKLLQGFSMVPLYYRDKIVLVAFGGNKKEPSDKVIELNLIQKQASFSWCYFRINPFLSISCNRDPLICVSEGWSTSGAAKRTLFQLAVCTWGRTITVWRLSTKLKGTCWSPQQLCFSVL